MKTEFKIGDELDLESGGTTKHVTITEIIPHPEVYDSVYYKFSDGTICRDIRLREASEIEKQKNQEQEGVTAKEILTDKWGKPQMNDTTYPMQYLKNMALEAMEVYARTKQPGLRDELNDFVKYLNDVKIFDVKYVVENYLKHRTNGTTRQD